MRLMYYDDEARRFNFLSGLLLGAVLGTGLALLAAPQGRPRKGLMAGKGPKSLARAVARARRHSPLGEGSRGEMLRAAARRMAR